MEPRLELQATPDAHGWRRMILGSRAGYNPTEMTKAAQMQQARFRFHAELNDLLSLGRRGRSFVHTFGVLPSLKDAIEAFGVPHTEVGLILANGEAAAFSYLLRDGDKISVYPVFRSLELTPLVPLQPRPEGEMRFVLDTSGQARSPPANVGLRQPVS